MTCLILFPSKQSIENLVKIHQVLGFYLQLPDSRTPVIFLNLKVCPLMREGSHGHETNLASMQLVLASSSPRRQQMFDTLNIEYHVLIPAPEAEKKLPGHLPLARLRQILPEISEAKAKDVASRYEHKALIIAADTVVYCQGQVLGKPGGVLVARRYLNKLNGRTHRVLSSVSVYDTQTGLMQSGVEITEVRFRKFSERELERYLTSGEAIDKAGAYAIQGWGSLLVDSIKGRQDNVVGFPLATLEEILKTFGRSLYDFARA